MHLRIIPPNYSHCMELSVIPSKKKKRKRKVVNFFIFVNGFTKKHLQILVLKVI